MFSSERWMTVTSLKKTLNIRRKDPENFLEKRCVTVKSKEVVERKCTDKFHFACSKPIKRVPGYRRRFRVRRKRLG